MGRSSGAAARAFCRDFQRGRYVRERIPDWEKNIPLIGVTVERLRQRPDYDPSRPSIEYYRSQKELLVLAPVQ